MTSWLSLGRFGLFLLLFFPSLVRMPTRRFSSRVYELVNTHRGASFCTASGPDRTGLPEDANVAGVCTPPVSVRVDESYCQLFCLKEKQFLRYFFAFSFLFRSRISGLGRCRSATVPRFVSLARRSAYRRLRFATLLFRRLFSVPRSIIGVSFCRKCSIRDGIIKWSERFFYLSFSWLPLLWAYYFALYIFFAASLRRIV